MELYGWNLKVLFCSRFIFEHKNFHILKVSIPVIIINPKNSGYQFPRSPRFYYSLWQYKHKLIAFSNEKDHDEILPNLFHLINISNGLVNEQYHVSKSNSKEKMPVLSELR